MIIISDANNTSNKVVVTCKVYTSWSPLSHQHSGVESWQRALLSVERGLLALDVPGLQLIPCLGVRVGIHFPNLGQVHLVARYKHMLSNCQGQHIPLLQCSTVLHKVLLQASASLAYVTSWALVTRDGVDHSLSPPLWNRVLGVDKLLPECPEQLEGKLDVQVA